MGGAHVRKERICKEVACEKPALHRAQRCRECGIANRAKQPSFNPDSERTKRCAGCLTEHDHEDFILESSPGSDGHYRTRYDGKCDDCRFQADWASGVDTPAVTGLVPYERAKREVAYLYRVLPKTWINRSGMLAQLHLLLMLKYGKVRDEQIDDRIAEVKADIAAFGVA